MGTRSALIMRERLQDMHRRGCRTCKQKDAGRACRVRQIGAVGCRTCVQGAPDWCSGLQDVRAGCAGLVQWAAGRACRVRQIGAVGCRTCRQETGAGHTCRWLLPTAMQAR